MGSLSDYVPSVDDVMSNPAEWLFKATAGPAAFLNASVNQGKREQTKDRLTTAQKAEYDKTHPEPIMPSISSAKLAAKRTYAKRRATGGRLSTILSDSETLG